MRGASGNRRCRRPASSPPGSSEGWRPAHLRFESFIEAGSVLGLHFALQAAADPQRSHRSAGRRRRRLGGRDSQHHLRTATGGREVQPPHDAGGRLRPAAAWPGEPNCTPARPASSTTKPDSLRHRVAAARGPDPTLVADLENYATREASRGAWASAASTLAVISRLSPSKSVRQQLLVRAVDAMVAGGDLVRAKPYAAEIAGFAAQRPPRRHPRPPRDSRRQPGRSRTTAHGPPGSTCDKTLEPDLPASLAQRNALHAMGRLRPLDMIEWAQQAITLGSPDQPERADAHAILGIGLGTGRTRRRRVWPVHESVLSTASSTGRGPTVSRFGWRTDGCAWPPTISRPQRPS